MSDLVKLFRRFRLPLVVGFDVVAWLTAYVVFAWLRFDAVAAKVPWTAVAAVAVCAALLYLALARAVRLHQGRASTASLEEMVLLGAGMAASGAVVFLANLYFQWIPRTVPAGAAMGALVFAAWGRATWRRLKEREEQGGYHESSTRVLVVGTGEAGRELLGSMLRDPRGTWNPVGLLDDDPHKRHRRLRAVPVVGTTTQLADQCRPRVRKRW